MSPEREIRLDLSAFLDSPQARALDLPRGAARALAERLLACAYDDLGKAPHLLEGDDLAEILARLLPARLGKRDPLAAALEPVLEAWLAFLVESAVVPHAFELRAALAEHLPAFQRAVASGELAGRARGPKPAPIRHRVAKTGRNDPCPCGSGRKFKQCCMKLGP
jgi:hypothetical protein